MRKVALILPLMMVALRAQSPLYEIRPLEGARLALEVHKTGLMSGKKHLFVFEKYHGTLAYDARAPEKSKVELVIETASIVLKDQWLSQSDMKKVHDHAVGKEMLEVNRFPQMRFTSAAVLRKTDGTFDVQGMLTIRNIDKPVTVMAVMRPQGDGPLHLTGKAQVKLRDYGLKPPSALLGAIGTRNEMAVEFVVLASPKR